MNSVFEEGENKIEVFLDKDILKPIKKCFICYLNNNINCVTK